MDEGGEGEVGGEGSGRVGKVDGRGLGLREGSGWEIRRGSGEGDLETWAGEYTEKEGREGEVGGGS